MKINYLLPLLFLLLISCDKSETEEVQPQVNPVALKLAGGWQIDSKEWFYTVDGQEREGERLSMNPVSKYGITAYNNNVRVTYYDGTGINSTYDLTEKEGSNYIKLTDGLDLGTKTNYRIKELTDTKLVLTADYQNIDLYDKQTKKKVKAKSSNTITLNKF